MRATILGFALVSSLVLAAASVRTCRAADKNEAIPPARGAQSDPNTASPAPQGSVPNTTPGASAEIRIDKRAGNNAGPATSQPGVGVDVGGNVNVDVNANPGGRAPQGERWRFRHHNGHWWYWLPRNRWVFWHNNGWVDYDPQSYSRYYPSNGGGRNVGPAYGYRGAIDGQYRHGAGYRGIRTPGAGVHIDAGGVDVDIGGARGGAIEERRGNRNP